MILPQNQDVASNPYKEVAKRLQKCHRVLFCSWKSSTGYQLLYHAALYNWEVVSFPCLLGSVFGGAGSFMEIIKSLKISAEA